MGLEKIYIDADQKYLSRVLIDITDFSPLEPDEEGTKKIGIELNSGEELLKITDYAAKGILAFKTFLGAATQISVPTEIAYTDGLEDDTLVTRSFISYWNESTNKTEPICLDITFFVKQDSEEPDDGGR